MTPTRRFIRRMKALVGLCLWYFLSACAPVQVGPFTPESPRPCASDDDCYVGEHCGFPAVDTHPVCLNGPSFDVW